MPFEQWLYKFPLLVRSLLQRRVVEQELDEELRYHFERQVEQNLARGMSDDEAREDAARAIGSFEKHKEECRDNWVVANVDKLARDVKHALRTLRRDIGFTIGVFLLLSLGIGTNVAVFSIINAILIRPLPYLNPDRLLLVAEVIPELSDDPRAVNPLHYGEWRRCRCFEDIALSDFIQELNLASHGDPQRVPSMRVTTNTFAILGVSAQVGRTFVPEDSEADESVVVISDGLWRRSFDADPDIVGKTINLDGVNSVIVGVLPKDFRHHATRQKGRIDVYRPWGVDRESWWTWTNNYSYMALARLADGTSAAAAFDELNAIQAAIASEHFTGANAALTLRAAVMSVHDWVTGESRDGLLLLLAAVGAALLVACLNIANLMLVRATARSREAGVRAALGASRVAIFRGVLTESVVLAFAGAAAGVGVAAGALKIFTSIAGAALPRFEEVRIDAIVLFVAVALAIASTIAFGLLPALKMTRVDPQHALRGGSRTVTVSRRQQRLRHLLVSVEVAVSATLLVIAGLLLSSFIRLDSVERGFDSGNVLTAEIGLPRVRYPDDDSRLRFYDSLLEELGSRPGVVAAGLTSALPLRGRNWGSTAIAAGTSPPAEEQLRVEYRFVSPGYIEAMGIPLLAGRTIAAEDYQRRVAMVSEQTAVRLWPGGDPIGRRFYRGEPDDVFDVIGTVPDVHSEDLATAPGPIVYVPLTAAPGPVFPTVSIAVRTADPSSAAVVLRNIVASLDRDLAVSKVQPMAQIESASLGERRFQLLLVVAFGAGSLLIAALGTYSVLAYAVSSRTQELAMRMTLGARPGTVAAMVLTQGMRPVVVGLGLGLIAAFLVGEFLSSLLFAVTPTDPATLTSVIAVTLAAALVASWIPARRVARTSLLEALRYQ